MRMPFALVLSLTTLRFVTMPATALGTMPRSSTFRVERVATNDTVLNVHVGGKGLAAAPLHCDMGAVTTGRSLDHQRTIGGSR